MTMNMTQDPPRVRRSPIRYFIDTNIALLLVIGALLAGIAAYVMIPREEEPQIVVTAADVLLPVPGASAEEIELQVATPVEALIAAIPGVEHVYATSQDDICMISVVFYAGEAREKSLTKLFTQLQAHQDQIPASVQGWSIHPLDADDIPILSVVLLSKTQDVAALRQIGNAVLADLRAMPEVGNTRIIGGQRREVQLILDPARLGAYVLSPLEVMGAIQGANSSLPTGAIRAGNQTMTVRTGPFLRSADDLSEVVVGLRPDAIGVLRPVYARQVGDIVDGSAELAEYTRIGFGPAASRQQLLPAGYATDREFTSVTLAIAKRKWSNAVTVSDAVKTRLAKIRGTIIPDDVAPVVTRDFGRTSNDKVNELVRHLLIAAASVLVLIGLSMGWREAGVVAFAIPVILLLTVGANYLVGNTINIYTLFAMILALGLLVDPLIVTVENIHRHLSLRQQPRPDAAHAAVREIFMPVVSATAAVILSFLPMFAISSAIGQYMKPLAFSVATSMLFSLVSALFIAPWATLRVLPDRAQQLGGESFAITTTLLYRMFSVLLRPMVNNRIRSWTFLGAVMFLFGLVLAIFIGGLVPVNIMPNDNKEHLTLVVDAPEGTTLEQTDAVLADLAELVRTQPEVSSYESYAGTASPVDGNGLGRHYFLRRGDNIGDLRVNLIPKNERQSQSHQFAMLLRPAVMRIATRHGVVVKLVESPTGPTTQAPLVGVVTGPENATHAELLAVARRVKELLSAVPDAYEVDWTAADEEERINITIDHGKASLAGIAEQEAVATIRMALAGMEAGTLRDVPQLEPVSIKLQLPPEMRTDLYRLMAIKVRGRTGALVPLGEIVRVDTAPVPQSIMHKDQRRVVFVTAAFAGTSPLEMALRASRVTDGQFPPGYQVNWQEEGELKVTIDAMRDLGLVEIAALLFIYILLVVQTGSFVIPVIIMLSIPLTLIGIIPGFWLLNIFAQPIGGIANPFFFTAVGMVGMLALGGIVVGNSVILISFIEQLRQRGRNLEDSLVEAGATRCRPIFLTAGAVLLGSSIILLDPVFGGLAWTMIFGVFVSTGFTLFVVPVSYHLLAMHVRNKSVSARPIAAESAIP